MSSSPIAREVKQVSGFQSFDDLRAAMPADPDATLPAEGATPAKPKRARRKTGSPSPTARPAPAPDPFMNDPRYREACAEMAAFGGKGMIIRGFDAGARALGDDTFKLNAKEERTWDNFFYVLSKKPMFDVGSPIFLALFFIITLCAQLGWRVVERTQSDFIIDLFRPKPDEPDAAKE